MSMTCAAAEDLVPWVVNGSAAQTDRAALHRHVATCDACRRDLAQTLALHRGLDVALGRLAAADRDAGRQLASRLAPSLAPRKTDAMALATSALRALGAPPVLTQPLDLLHRLAHWRPSTNLIAPFIPTLTQAASAP